MAYVKNKYKILVDCNRAKARRVLDLLFKASYVFDYEHRYKTVPDVDNAYFFSMDSWKYIVIGSDKECKRVLNAVKAGDTWRLTNFAGHKTIKVEDLIKLELLK